MLIYSSRDGFLVFHSRDCLDFITDWTCAYDSLWYQDIAGTLATEEAEDAAQVAKLRSALESVDHKRRKVVIVI